MIRMKAVFAIAAMLGGVADRAAAVELQRATTDAWQEYVRHAGEGMQARLDGSKPFLWVDEIGDRALRVRQGEVLVAPAAGNGQQTVPNGLIHDWIGAAFIPNTTIETLLTVVHDYDRYKEIYKPVVVDSRSIDSGAAGQSFSMVWQRHVVFVNATVRGRYRAYDVSHGPHRGYSVVEATSLQQIEDYGRPGEHLLPLDTGDGFIWRIHSVSRYEERDGGVYLEIEAMLLSRDIPASLRWLVSPVVNHLSIASMSTTLRQTRQAVDRHQVIQERLTASDRKGLN
jgi:hypothetical protein